MCKLVPAASVHASKVRNESMFAYMQVAVCVCMCGIIERFGEMGTTDTNNTRS